jgi:transcriptional regulator with XRE-family HTH domain
LGALIRQQRELAELPMREFARAVGISNPYLSQIERGLRAPSEAVLESIAETLHISADELYRMAGFVERPRSDEQSTDLDAAIEAAEELAAPQRWAMLEIYRTFPGREHRSPHAQRVTLTLRASKMEPPP